ncbi:Suppressor protein stp22 of temperature-sensitive alpha-factor receptor and arginine permease [Tilletia horrida]|uniref:Suppressor protein stp22 of temperature-sensitive alpha-factor receptor and arginine permease n=1 Tax=Tilletia horrida TaxID=155126 RepID=A0AAN6JPR7_9BASI|nr:Suppressor protein stp22 of temperature-sensitive alpha-factor receptor and arginine permease [Tilletia horrida]KAK0562332.1 Suppressor protein stp22 of temperature-sensitive alpha-factor receptor and arginine permease [Tilletia horrida]
MDHSVVQQWLRQTLSSSGPYSSSSSSSRDRIYADIDRILLAFSSLSPRTEVYTHDDGRSQLLLEIHGTIPITYKGATYHIPISLWIPHAYPQAQPIVYVTPTAQMLVRKGKHVDPSGRVMHPYLDDQWARKPEAANLLDLIHVCQDDFSQQPPVYAKPPPRSASSSTPTPSSPSPSSRQATPAATASGPAPPPLPPTRPQSVASPSASPQLQQSPRQQHSQPPPPPPLPPPIPGPQSPRQQQPVSPQSAAAPTPPPLPPSIPQLSQQQQQQQYAQYQQQQYHQQGQQMPPSSYQQQQHPGYQQQPSVAPPPPPPPHPQQQQPYTQQQQQQQQPQQRQDPVNQAPPPPIPLNPELLKLHSAVHNRFSTTLSSLSTALSASNDQLSILLSDLERGAVAIEDERSRLEAVRDVCRVRAEKVGEVVQRAREAREVGIEGEGGKEASREDVDGYVVATSLVGNQLLTLVAEDHALEDTLYQLGRALNAERIDLDRFLKQTRHLAREQFMRRALARKICEGMRWPVE